MVDPSSAAERLTSSDNVGHNVEIPFHVLTAQILWREKRKQLLIVSLGLLGPDWQASGTPHHNLPAPRLLLATRLHLLTVYLRPLLQFHTE